MFTIIAAILIALLIWKVIIPALWTGTVLTAVALHKPAPKRFYCGGCVRPLARNEYPKAGGKLCNDCLLVGNLDVSTLHPEVFQAAIRAQEQDCA